MALTSARLRATDTSTLAYNAAVVVIILIFSSRIPSWHRIILLNLATIAIVLLLSRVGGQSHPLLRFLRDFYPMFFFFAAYEQTGRMNRVLFPELLDPLFQRLEYALFGFQPAVEFARRFPQPWFNEYMHIAYFSYYLLFPSLGLILHARGARRVFDEYMFALSSSFYAFFLIFILLPVAGAATLEAPPLPAAGPFTVLMNVIYAHLEPPGGAFPSSHVGIALLVMIYARRHLSCRAFSLYALLGISLMLSTVYCRYHYAVDVLAGLAAGSALTIFFRRLHGRIAAGAHPAHRARSLASARDM